MTSSESEPYEGSRGGPDGEPGEAPGQVRGGVPGEVADRLPPDRGAGHGAGPPARVLAAGHLHPGMLFLRLLDSLRAAILPVIIALVANAPWLALATLVFVVIGMIFALARYLTFQYRLTEDELITTEGILHRQERRIPVDRIQDLNFESTLLRRFLGLVVVSVETASGQGAEARLDSLSRHNAEYLREVLYTLRAGRGGAAEAPQVHEVLLFKSSAAELALLGLTNNRIGGILLAILGFLELSDELGFGESVGGAAGGVFERLARVSPVLVVAMALAVFFLFLLAGWLLSVTANFILYHEFALTEREDVLQRRFGLITTRAQSLPRRKIQRVLLESTLVRRLLGMVVVRADSAGSGMGEGRQKSRGGARDVIAPLTSRVRGEMLLPWLLLGVQSEPLPWNRVSPRVVVRVFMKGVLLTLAILALGVPSIGWPALFALSILPAGWLVGFLAYQNLAYARLPGHVAFRWGILGRYRAFVPLRKVQGAVLRAGPVERVLGLAHLTVYVAGGSPTTLGNLPRDEAERLKLEVAHEAARSRFVW